MTASINLQLTFPAPDRLLWVCPVCGPVSNSRIAPSRVFRRAGIAGLGSSEWRKIQCDGCERKFMLRISSDGQVTGLPIGDTSPEPAGQTIYSAADSGAWLNG